MVGSVVRKSVFLDLNTDMKLCMKLYMKQVIAKFKDLIKNRMIRKS